MPEPGRSKELGVAGVICACLMVCLALVSSCEKLPVAPETVINELDTSHPGFIQPVTTIDSAPAPTIAVPTATFSWHGNSSVALFSYRIDSSAWSGWTAGTGVTITYLDDGPHAFSVRGEHRNQVTVEAQPPVRNFTVSAVAAPAVIFQPRLLSVDSGAAFSYEIRTLGVTSLFASRLIVSYDPLIAAIDSVSPGGFLAGNGGSVLPPFVKIDNVTGTVEVDLVVVGGTPKGVSGGGVIAVLWCRSLRPGVCDFSFDASSAALRDTSNAAIVIHDIVNGRLIVR